MIYINRTSIVKLILFFSLLFSTLSIAQTSLFNSIQPILPGSPLPFVNSTRGADVNFEGLKYFPDSLEIVFSDKTSYIIEKQLFYPRAGYIFRDDETDPPGTPEFWVDINVENQEFSYLWAGSNDDIDAVITVNKGQLVATFSTNTKRFVITKNSADEYMLTDIYVPGLPSNRNDLVTPDNKKQFLQLPDKISISHIKSFDVSNVHNAERFNRGNTNTVLDVLIVFTETARIESGGVANDPNDTQDIETNIIQVVDNTNIALTNSENNTRITRFHVAKLNGFTHQGSYSATLNALQQLQSLKTLRTNVGADIVSLIIEDAPASVFNACGVAFGQTVPSSNWSVGAGFNDWSYSVLQQQCVIYDNTFGHELGHLMGAHHVKDVTEVNQVTIDAITNNGYGYAFGYKSSNFKTLMSVTQATPLRRLYFSNPDKFVDNQFIGDVIDANNSRVIDELSPAMSLYKTRPDLIFINGFE